MVQTPKSGKKALGKVLKKVLKGKSCFLGAQKCTQKGAQHKKCCIQLLELRVAHLKMQPESFNCVLSPSPYGEILSQYRHLPILCVRLFDCYILFWQI